MKPKTKFPVEFTPETIELIHQKCKLWKFIQKSGVRTTCSSSEKYRTLCQDTKRVIKKDCNAKLEREATELSDAFKQDIFY